MTDKTYNGWANYETWNVALWISNDESLYSLSQECKSYSQFADMMGDLEGEIKLQTPDGVSWKDSGLDIDALDEMINEE